MGTAGFHAGQRRVSNGYEKRTVVAIYPADADGPEPSLGRYIPGDRQSDSRTSRKGLHPPRSDAAKRKRLRLHALSGLVQHREPAQDFLWQLASAWKLLLRQSPLLD